MISAPALSHFPNVETHLLQSVHVAQTFKIQVVRPMQRRAETRRFPVVYVTDGNAVFDLFKGMAWLLQAYKLDILPFILVMIGYPSESPVAGEVLRGRDLTFPGCPDWLSGFQMPWEGVLTPESGTRTFGGAEDFQKFICEELIPFVDVRYETEKEARVYFGHSVGGAFGLFTLFTQTRLFQKYVISSPALAYHGTTMLGVRHERLDFLFERARQYIAAGKPMDDVHLYMSVGTQEEFEPLIASWQFTSNFYRMAALLRTAGIPGLTLTTEVFSGEGHATVWPVAFMHGMQAVLGASERQFRGG